MFSMFSNLSPFDLPNKTRVGLVNLRRNICNNRIDDRTSPDLVMVIISACLLIF